MPVVSIEAETVYSDGTFFIYRAMRQAADGGPEVGRGSRFLGVRPGTGYATDIPVDPEGHVHPCSGGLSVAPGDPAQLPDQRRPREMGGRGKDPVWSLNTRALPPGLTYRDDNCRDPGQHGFIEPQQVMPFDEFEELIAATRAGWTRVV